MHISCDNIFRYCSIPKQFFQYTLEGNLEPGLTRERKHTAHTIDHAHTQPLLYTTHNLENAYLIEFLVFKIIVLKPNGDIYNERFHYTPLFIYVFFSIENLVSKIIENYDQIINRQNRPNKFAPFSSLTCILRVFETKLIKCLMCTTTLSIIHNDPCP